MNISVTPSIHTLRDSYSPRRKECVAKVTEKIGAGRVVLSEEIGAAINKRGFAETLLKGAGVS